MHGFEIVGLAIFMALAVLPLVPFAHFARRYLRSRSSSDRTRLAWSAVAMVSAYSAVCIDAFLIEPNWVELKRLDIPANISKPLTILHLSDLHIEPNAVAREQWLIEQVEQLSPDLVLITGDIHQMDNMDAVSCRRVLEHIRAPMGVYGVVGYDSVSVLNDADPELLMLRDKAIVLERDGDTIGLVGFDSAMQVEALCAQVGNTDFRIVMNHAPDLADTVAGNTMDLYLCGHTHGGQVRIPFWGAIITNCASGKKYEAGLYRNGQTWIYTSRGLGLEPRPAPQVRFLCRPEITLITLVPSN